MAINPRLDQHAATERHDLCRHLGRIFDAYEIQPVGMGIWPVRGQRIHARARITVGREHEVLDAVGSGQLEDFVVEQGLVESRIGVRIAGDQRAPNPFSGRRQDVGRITTAGSDDRKNRPLRIREDRFAATVGQAMRLEQHLRAMLQRKLFGRVDIVRGDEAQPRWLPMLARRYIPLNQSGDRAAVERRLGVVCPIGLNIAERPAEQSRIELFGGGEVRRHQFDKDHLADVMLLAGGANDLLGRKIGRDRGAAMAGAAPATPSSAASRPGIRKWRARLGCILRGLILFGAIESIRFALRCRCPAVSAVLC